MASTVACLPALEAPARATVIEVEGVSRSFDAVEALRGVSLRVRAGEIHALLGANGAGKTTLLRVLAGLVTPSGGSARIGGRALDGSRAMHAQVGLVPSGDRTFYLRLSALENLVFFARLHGLSRRAARARARDLLEAVGLAGAADRRVNAFSHGMQKRLGFARALLGDPAVLLIDEATHDLDPVAARGIRDLTATRAAAGAAVAWATQRIEELPGFADRVTVLQDGAVCFSGSPAALAAQAGGRRFLLRVEHVAPPGALALAEALARLATLVPAPDGDPSHMLLTLDPGASLGAAIATIAAAGGDVVACREERPPVEDGFLALVGSSL
jgi:ABC-2 type transport system ATP-binding protein